MRKIDNSGWGLIMFILFMAIFFVSIITVIYMINNFNEGLSPRRSEGVSYSQYETYKRYEKIPFVNQGVHERN